MSMRCRKVTAAVCVAAMLAGTLHAGESRLRVQTAEMSRAAEAAIDRALRYLDATQNADGSWGSTYKSAETALAIMAFMVRGHMPGRGQYGARIDKAVTFLVNRGREKGGFLGSERQGMYEHGLATLALCEAWGESDNEQLRDVIKKAVDVIFRSQNPAGGWRYSPQPVDADLSVTVMQIMALASAKEAGILVPDKVLEKATRYVLSCQHPLGGFCYQPGGAPGFARTAAGVMSLFMADVRDSVSIRRGLDYLLKADNSKFQSVSYYFYAHYYAIQAMYQSGEANYQRWYPSIRDAVLARQRPDGSFSGADAGASPAYSTAMAVLILGVPYRYLPIYQR